LAFGLWVYERDRGGLRARHPMRRNPTQAAYCFESSFANSASRRSISASDFAMVSRLSRICLASLSRSRRMDATWCCALANGGLSDGSSARSEPSTTLIPARVLECRHPGLRAGPLARATDDRDAPARWRSICRWPLWPTGNILSPGREAGRKGTSLRRNAAAAGGFGVAGKIAAQTPSVSPKTKQMNLPDSCAVHGRYRNQASASNCYGWVLYWHIPCHHCGKRTLRLGRVRERRVKTRDF